VTPEARARHRPILVTGGHRSGTTWVGKMLALAPGVGYIHEPFNPTTPVGVSGARFPRFFEYVCAENEGDYGRQLERTLAFRYNTARQLAALRSPVDVARTAADWIRFARARATGARPLVKDPIALFSSEWLADRFGMDVLVLIRHPAAFASSLIRLGWRHRFESFLEQPLLMEHHLHPFEDEIRRHAGRETDVLAQAVLLWRIIYEVVDTFRRRRPDWSFARHEDISREPASSFGRVYEQLGLEYTEAARQAIRSSTSAANPAEASDVHGTRLDSEANISSWKRRLSPEQIALVRRETEDLASRFYSDADW
jgi:hypothetical protein